MIVACVEAAITRHDAAFEPYLTLLHEHVRQFGGVPALNSEAGPAAEPNKPAKAYNGLFAFANRPTFEAFRKRRLTTGNALHASETVVITQPIPGTLSVRPAQLRIPYHLLNFH